MLLNLLNPSNANCNKYMQKYILLTKLYKTSSIINLRMFENPLDLSNLENKCKIKIANLEIS